MASFPNDACGTTINRRNSLAMAGGLVMTAAVSSRALAQAEKHAPTARAGGEPPKAEIEKALGADGELKQGVFSADIGRKDIGEVKAPLGVTFTPDFELHHEFQLQMLNDNQAMFNGELAVLPHEADAVVDRILAEGLVFQAFHQHFVSLEPQIFHIHVRGKGSPRELAAKYRNVVAATATPMPQYSPKKPSTPLNHERLAQIVGGDATIGGDGVVTIAVPRREAIQLGGVTVNPTLGVLSHVDFKPMEIRGGKVVRAAAAPDFAMTANEVSAVMRVMRKHGFEIGCLYNQETDEHPQLYFSHQLAVGEPEQLARAVREGLEQTGARFLQQIGSR